MPHLLRREEVVLDDQDVLAGENRKLMNIHDCPQTRANALIYSSAMLGPDKHWQMNPP
jgi:hypothetical protein